VLHPCKGKCYEGGGITAAELGAEAAKKQPIAGTCDVRLRDRLEASIARAHGPSAGRAPTAWDHRSTPAFHDVVSSALALTADDEAQLARDGFAVPARLAYDDFASAYYDVHRAQLPLYVSADSILHAIYASHDHLLAELEREQLNIRLDDALGRMHCALAVAAKDYPRDVAIDLDLYLTVARALLGNQYDELPAILGTGPRAAAIVQLVRDGGALTEITLFGRHRAFDPSAYVPRGHYTGDERLEAYFRAAMWLSRLELNLVSRDTRSSSPV
jgi:hypothetical protein